MKYPFIVSLVLVATSAASCDNPLFSEANWPTDIPRPRYLSTPQAVSNTTFCSKALSGSDQTCCDATTIADIVALFHTRKGRMVGKGEDLEGGVRGTFNNFDPDNQQNMTNGGRLLANNNTKGGNGNGNGPPPKEDRPQGYESADVPEDDMNQAGAPNGKGKEKKRPGVLKLSQAGKEAMKNITRTMNALMRQFAFNMGTCMQAQLKHLAGMLCMGCDPEWTNWVTGSGSVLTVAISQDACDKLVEGCLDFVKMAQNLPALVDQMKAAVDAIIQSEIAAGTITAADLPTEDLNSQTKPPAQVAPVCTTDAECETFICEVMSKGKGVAPEPETVADPAAVSSSSGRLLAATVTYQITSSGYNSLDQGTSAATTVTIDGTSTDTSPLDTSNAMLLIASLVALAF